jgi:hypothetical protein
MLGTIVRIYLHLFWMGFDDHRPSSYRADIGLALCQVLSESVRLTSLDLRDVTGRHEFGGHSLELEGLFSFSRTWKVACSLCYHIPCFMSNDSMSNEGAWFGPCRSLTANMRLLGSARASPAQALTARPRLSSLPSPPPAAFLFPMMAGLEEVSENPQVPQLPRCDACSP